MSEQWIRPREAAPLGGDERFNGLEASIADFWSFAMSDLRTNNVRGYLAEFLVARAVGATGCRVEWDAYDVRTPEGVTIEVKSSGRLQVWGQRALSTVRFTGVKSKEWTPEGGYAATATHNADVYVFAVQTATRHDAYDVLDVSQWEFFVASRSSVEATGHGSIGLSGLRNIATGPLAYADLAATVRVVA